MSDIPVRKIPRYPTRRERGRPGGEAPVRIPFARRLTRRVEVRGEVVRLHQQARARSDLNNPTRSPVAN